MTEKICRLCLQTITKIYPIDKSTLETLKLNPRISKETVICTECASCLETFANFKPACVYMGNSTLGLTNLKNEYPAYETTSNLKSLEETGKKCSFCANISGKGRLNSLNGSKIVESLVNLLQQHIPEMNLKNTGELLTCESCYGTLRGLSNFISKCSEVEEKINKYTEMRGTNHKGQIELKDVQQFIFEPTVKLEMDSFGDNELEDQCDEIQKEYLETAGAEIKYESDPETIIQPDYVDIKLETTEDVDIKSERIARTEYVDVKSGAIIKTEDIEIKPENSDSERFLSAVVSSQPVSTTLLGKRKRVKSKGKTSNKPKTTRDDVSKATMYRCDLCSFQAKYKSLVKKHMVSHKPSSETTMYQCDFCEFSTKYKQNLRGHLLTHKEGPVDSKEVTIYQCNTCDYATYIKANLSGHQLSHKDPSEVTMHQCTSCSFQTKYKNVLQRHIDKHSPLTTTYQCYSCDFSTKHKRNLRGHMLTHKNGIKEQTLTHKPSAETAKYQCDSCGFNTKYKRSLQEHMFIHKDPFEAPLYQCDSCDYRTNYKSQVNNHKLSHKGPSEVTMYQCDACPFQTKYKIGMQRHKADVHSLKTRTYQCGSCDFKTKYKHNLDNHMLIHKDPSEVKFYQCDSCDYKTKYKNNLQGHVVTHKLPSETTMYQCDSCSFVTKNKWYLNKHRKLLCKKGN